MFIFYLKQQEIVEYLDTTYSFFSPPFNSALTVFRSTAAAVEPPDSTDIEEAVSDEHFFSSGRTTATHLIKSTKHDRMFYLGIGTLHTVV